MIRLSTIAVVVAWLFGIGVVLFGRNVIPAKYYTDSDRMAALSELGDPGRASKSDVATVSAYKALGLSGSGMTRAAGLFNITTAFAMILWILRERVVTRAVVGLMLPWFAIMSVYLSMYSKEYLTVICIGILVLGSRRLSGIGAAALGFVAYGAFVRAYWLVMLAYAIAFGALLRLRISRTQKTLLGLGGIVLSLSIFSAATGFHLTDARTLLVAFRSGDADSQTLVQNFVANVSPLHDMVNLIGGWFRFLLPISLLRFGGAQHVVFCTLQVVTVIWVTNRVARDFKLNASSETPRHRELIALAAVGMSVTMVLSAFDGDFGSYARHQIALVPWLVATLCPVRTDISAT